MRAVICGYYGQGNGGDEALLVSLLQMLPSQVKPVVLSANPQATEQCYGVESCANRAWGQVFKTLQQGDVFIWGGGSLMQDATSINSALYYGGLMALAQLLGLKTIAWAQGIGPLNHPLTRWLTRTVLSNCDGVTVRDEASWKLLSNWHIGATLAPDPVWLLTGASSDLDLSSVKQPKIAVNLRRHSSLTPTALALLTEALILLQQTTSAYLLLIPFQTAQDLDVTKAIAAQLKGHYQIVQRQDPRQLKGLFREVNLTIGMRLHSLIMAASEGSRCFALSYDPKVTRLMAEVGLLGYELTDLPHSAPEISQAWQNCLEQGQPLDVERREMLREQTQVHQALLEQICQVS